MFEDPRGSEVVGRRHQVERARPQVGGGAKMTTSTVQRSVRLSHHDHKPSRNAVVYFVAVTLHGADQVHRGMDVVTTQVMWAGSTEGATRCERLAMIAIRPSRARETHRSTS